MLNNTRFPFVGPPVISTGTNFIPSVLTKSAFFVALFGVPLSFAADGGVEIANRRRSASSRSRRSFASPLNKAMDVTAKQRQASNPGYFQNPNWPVLLATEVAGSMGILPTAAPSAPAEAGLPVPAPVPNPGKVQTGTLFASARTGTSGFRSDQTTSGTTITQQAMHGSSVVVDYTFKQPNDAPTDVQCFFRARDEASGKRFIYHAEKRPAHASEKALFNAPTAAETISSQSAYPVDVTYSDGSTGTGTVYERTSKKGTKLEGWIVRFVSSRTRLDNRAFMWAGHLLDGNAWSLGLSSLCLRSAFPAPGCPW